MIVGVDEELEVLPQIVMAVVMAVVVVARDGGVLDGAVHAFDLPVRPRVVRFGEPVLDAVLATDVVQAVDAQASGPAIPDLRQVGELDAVIGQDGVRVVRHWREQGSQERHRGRPVSLLVQLSEGELRGTIDADVEMQLALFGADLGDVDLQIADRLDHEALLLGSLAFQRLQPTDAVTLQTAVQRRLPSLGGGLFCVITSASGLRCWRRQWRSLTAPPDVVEVLDHMCGEVGYPLSIRVDHGSEFILRDLDRWVYTCGVTLNLSWPDNPTDNASIEPFNGKFRAECLRQHGFISLDDALLKCEAWRRDYNEVRPHSAIGNMPAVSLINSSAAHSPPLPADAG